MISAIFLFLIMIVLSPIIAVGLATGSAAATTIILIAMLVASVILGTKKSYWFFIGTVIYFITIVLFILNEGFLEAFWG